MFSKLSYKKIFIYIFFLIFSVNFSFSMELDLDELSSASFLCPQKTATEILYGKDLSLKNLNLKDFLDNIEFFSYNLFSENIYSFKENLEHFVNIFFSHNFEQCQSKETISCSISQVYETLGALGILVSYDLRIFEKFMKENKSMLLNWHDKFDRSILYYILKVKNRSLLNMFLDNCENFSITKELHLAMSDGLEWLEGIDDILSKTNFDINQKINWKGSYISALELLVLKLIKKISVINSTLNVSLETQDEYSSRLKMIQAFGVIPLISIKTLLCVIEKSKNFLFLNKELYSQLIELIESILIDIKKNGKHIDYLNKYKEQAEEYINSLEVLRLKLLESKNNNLVLI